MNSPVQVCNSRQAGDTDTGVLQIGVTPEMLEAGIQVYLGRCPDSGSGDAADERMLREIFEAMTRASL